MYRIINCAAEDIEIYKKQAATGRWSVIEFYDKQGSPTRYDRVGEHTLRINAFDWSSDRFKAGSRDIYKADGWQMFEVDQAQAIKNFVEERSPHIHTLIVACSAGVSRSSAAAMYLAGKYNVGWVPNWSVRPNMDIYYKLSENERGLLLPPTIIDKK